MTAPWTPGVMEYPADVNGYSEDQQLRLGVDAQGNRIQLPERMQGYSAVPAPQPSLHRTITPGYAASLLSSPKVLAAMCQQYFRKYDQNQNGVLEVEELIPLTMELRQSLGVPFMSDESAIRASMAQCGASTEALSYDEFYAWFAQEMQRDLPVADVSIPSSAEAVEVRVQAVGGAQVSMSVPLKCTVRDFKTLACRDLGLPTKGVRILLGNRVFERDDGMLKDFGVKHGCMLMLLIAPLMVRRHVYKAGCLATSDEVDLSPDARLEEQRSIIEPPECKESTGPVNYRPEIPVFAVPLHGSAPPKFWEAGGGQTIDWRLTAGEVFGEGTVDLVVTLR
eukprot:TRINITY_DN81129_c0_g1_i1.p1 TRINITY_DN81129_c0_g1~~TRINITY_DN81129_c0_g1_i1.p1  ORF type:complete len:337 (-),score=58.11 TRINITY_DN81129_c0_g1_i1:34-1044(-)